MQYFTVTLTMIEGDETAARKVVMGAMLGLHKGLQQAGCPTHVTVLDSHGDYALSLRAREGQDELDREARRRGYANAAEALADAWRHNG